MSIRPALRYTSQQNTDPHTPQDPILFLALCPKDIHQTLSCNQKEFHGKTTKGKDRYRADN